jgi:aspartate racemase
MIGIVGGVGPYAGLDLLKKIYDNTIANNDQEHLELFFFQCRQALMIEQNT